jgi:phosphonate transport system ATP-binding protein
MDPAHQPVLSIEGLGKTWPDGTVALSGVSFDVAGGEIVAILGGSGSGKSTLLRAAARLIEPTAGRVRVAGRDLTAARGRELARTRARIGFVFQQFNLIPSYTALENVLTGRISYVGWLRGLVGVFGPTDRALAERCLSDVGMRDKARAHARELSGGQQQRVAIARAFAQEPRVLFADEPTASLDPRLSEIVLELLRDYGRARGVPVLINAHTVEQVRHYADRVLGLRAGRLVHDGRVADMTQATLDHIYGAKEEAA